MTDTVVGTGLIKSLGGKWITPISALEIQEALAWMPTPEVIVAASVVIDQLKEMETGFLFSQPGRPYSRSIKIILEYYQIRGDRLQDVVRILAHHGYARSFFSLAVPANDDGLKQYLIDSGVVWEQVLFYYEFSMWDPVRFTGGFMVGLGYSAASILEVLKDLFDFSVDAFRNPEGAANKISELVDGLRQISLESLAAMAKQEWANWQKEFSQALLNLDFDRAGFLVGKLAGDLWQLLTGIRALAKLPGMTMKLARRFGVLFSQGARYAQRAVDLLVELLGKLAALIQEASAIGYRAVANFFQDTKLLLEKLGEGALIIIDKTGAMLINIPEKGLLLEGVGFLPEGHVLAQANEGVTTVVARVKVGFNKGLKYFQDLKSGTSKKVKQIKNSAELLREIKRVEKLGEELVKEWRNTVKELFNKYDVPVNPMELGKWVHTHIAGELDRLRTVLSAKYKSLPEIEIRKLAELLEEGEAVARADIPLLDFAKGWPGLYEALGVADEEELIKLLKRMGYKKPEKTLIGDLVSDGIFYNDETKRMMSIDWASGRGRISFALEFEDAMKAGESLTLTQKKELARKFLAHSLREYALREAILEFVFEGWDTKVVEIMYEPFRIPKK